MGGWRQGTARGTPLSPPCPNSFPETSPESHSPLPSLSAVFINFAAKAGDPHAAIPWPGSPLPPRAPLMPELDTFPLHSQTSPSPGPLTEQSFIKLFHALSGRGAPGDGGLFRPFVGAPQDRPA